MTGKKSQSKTESDKTRSSLTKDLNRARKTAEKQMKMNTLRKYQLNILDKFLKKLLREGRITKEELKQYMPKKEQAEKEVFSEKNEEGIIKSKKMK